MTDGFPAWPEFDRKTEGLVAKILRSGRVNYWTGDIGREFEAAFAKRVGAKHAVSVTNGTAALDLALEALGIGEGDEVICTPYSFIASSMCTLHLGAVPVFCDVGDDHLMDPAKIEALVTERTKAVIVVHLFGMVADMGRITRIARKHGLFVIEDCAQCLGGTYRGRTAGTIGDVGCYSFCQAKHITTGGEGGMIVTKRRDVAETVKALRDHGRDGRGRNVRHRIPGYNARLTEIQSAIGLGELDRLDSWNLPNRRRNADKIIGALGAHPLVRGLPTDTAMRRASFWLVPFVLKEELLKVPVAEFIQRVQKAGGAVYEILWPIAYREPAFAGSHWRGRCPKAEELPGATIGFWVHPNYTSRHIEKSVRAFLKVAEECT